MKSIIKSEYIPVILFTVILVPMSFFNYDLYHSVSESFATLILFAIYLINWNTKDYHNSTYLTILGIGFLFVGVLNLIHVLNYNNLVIHGPFMEQWISMQYFLALTILFPLIPKIRKNYNLTALILVYGLVTLLIILSIYLWSNFPSSYDYDNKRLTDFKIYSEYAIIVVLLLSLWLMYKQKESFEEKEYKYAFSGILLLIFSEFSFTLYGATTEFFNAFGHLLRVFTFYMFYKAYIITCLRQPMEYIFRDLNNTRNKLSETNKNLEKTVEERTKELVIEVEEHKRAETRFYNLFESSPQPILIVDDQGKITLSNIATNQVFGYETNELIGKSINVLLPDHLKGGHQKRVEGFIETPRTRVMGAGLELSARKKSGINFPVEISLSPLNDGGTKKVIAVVNDITERKLSEDVLRRKNFDLEKKNHELDSFIYRISHEIKAPVSTMLGLTNLFKRDRGKKTENLFIEKMEEAIKRLNDYISNIVSFANSNKVTLNPQVIDFESTIKNLFSEIKLNYPDNKTKLNFKSSGKHPFFTEASILKIIFEQLITNAFIYRNCKMNNCYVNVEVVKDDGAVKILVSDNGTGIKKEYLNDIFKMYFRGSYLSKGSGLGLYIVKESVQALNGNISVESKEGEGTTFTIELPSLNEIVNEDSDSPIRK